MKGGAQQQRPRQAEKDSPIEDDGESKEADTETGRKRQRRFETDRHRERYRPSCTETTTQINAHGPEEGQYQAKTAHIKNFENRP